MSKRVRCVICGKSVKDNVSNNPRPVKYYGRCCDRCDKTVVLPARKERMDQGLSAYEGNYKWSEKREQSYLKHVMRTGEKATVILYAGKNG